MHCDAIRLTGQSRYSICLLYGQVLHTYSMLIEEIIEDEGAIWTDGKISWLSIHRGYYHYKIVHVVNGTFRP